MFGGIAVTGLRKIVDVAGVQVTDMPPDHRPAMFVVGLDMNGLAPNMNVEGTILLMNRINVRFARKSDE